MPWLQRDPDTGHAPFDCNDCQLEHVQRRVFHCGWLAEDEWLPCELPARIGPGPYTAEVCPGYLVAQPQIGEAARAAAALKAGALRDYYPRASAVLLDAAMELTAAYQRYEAEQMAELAKKR